MTVGASTTQTWTVTNTGPSTLTGATLKITVPKGLTPTALTLNSAAQTTPAAGTETTVPLPPVPPMGRAVAQLTAKADTGASGILRTSATVAARGPFTGPVVPVGVLVTGAGTLTLTADPAGEIPAKAGTLTEVNLIAANNGTTALNGTRLTLTPPKGVTIRDVQADGVALDTTTENGAVTARLGTLGPGASTTVTVILATGGTLAGKAALTASVCADQSAAPPDTTVTLTVTREAALVPACALRPDPPTAGQDHAFVWTVTNTGPSTSDPRSLTATASKGVTPLAADPHADINGQTITWTALPALTIDRAWTLTVVATLTKDATL
ncbi:hypothetical protein M4438_37540, partial [Streptomyces lavenduligriseus]|nr:hypothetical protein [Streptomyces lavenduligriseus]